MRKANLLRNCLKPWLELRRLSREHHILFATMFINRAGTMAFAFLALFLTAERKFSPAQTGFVFTTYGIVSIIAAFLGGKLSDRFTPWHILRGLLVLIGLLIGIFPLLPNYPAIILCAILWSLAAEGFRPVVMSMVAKISSDQDRKIAFAYNRLAVNLGMSIGPAAGGFLAEHSYQSVFYCNAAASILAAAVLSFFSFRVGKNTNAAEAQLPANSKTLPGYRNTPYVAFLIAMVLLHIAYFQVDTTLSLFIVRNLNLSSRYYGFVFTINTLLIVLLEIPLNVWLQKWSMRKALIVGSLFFACGFGILAFANAYWIIAVATVVWTFGEMISSPAMSAAVTHFAPKKRIGEYMGMLSMSFGTALSIGPFFGTYLLQNSGGPVLWGSSFLICLIATYILYRALDWRAASNSLDAKSIRSEPK